MYPRLKILLVTFSILLFFLLIGMTRQVFAVTCDYSGIPEPTTWHGIPHFYGSAAEASQACAALKGSTCFTYNCSGSAAGTCSWRAGYIEYWVDNKPSTNDQSQFLFCAADPACPAERAALTSQCGGSDKYTIDEATCDGQCNSLPCADERAAFEQECGGPDKYTINEETCQGKCNSPTDDEPCADERAALEQQCGGPTQYLINIPTCMGECKEGCRDKARDACHAGYRPYTDLDGNPGDFGMFNVDWYDEVDGRCIYECKCDNYRGESNFDFTSCSVTGCDTDTLAANCPSGLVDITDQSTCAYRCRDCETEKERLDKKCNGNYTLLACGESQLGNGYCLDDLSGTGDDTTGSTPDPNDPRDPPEGPGVDPYLPKTCEDYRAACNPACDFACSESDPRNNTCSCASPDPDGSDPKEPSADPTDPDDGNGWLESIKNNTDAIIGQNEDIKGWLEGIKGNADTANELLKESNDYARNSSENIRKIVDNTDVLNKNMQAGLGEVKNSVDGVKVSVDNVKGAVIGVKNSVDGVKGAVDGLTSALGNVGISTGGGDLAAAGDLGNGGEITGIGYGAAPTGGDLPSAVDTQTAFGTLQQRPEDGYRASVGGMLSGFSIELVDMTCHYEIPIPRFDYIADLNFCPYQQTFELIGYLLIALTSVYVFASYV